MATTVLLQVTPKVPANPYTDGDSPLPTDLADLLTAAGQSTEYGFSRDGDQPWQWRFQLFGRDRAQAGENLLPELSRLGYEADLVIIK